MTREEFLTARPIFRSRDFAKLTKMRVDSATRVLHRYQKRNIIEKVSRGIWVNKKHPMFSPYGVVPYLLDQEHGYISFLTALHRHEIISQIPQTIFVASTGHTRKLHSKIATFSFIQLQPKYMRYGVEWFSSKVIQYGLATAEKALLDCLYISIRKGNQFGFFPELDLTYVKKKNFKDLLRQHQFPKFIEKAIVEKFQSLFQ